MGGLLALTGERRLIKRHQVARGFSHGFPVGLERAVGDISGIQRIDALLEELAFDGAERCSLGIRDILLVERADIDAVGREGIKSGELQRGGSEVVLDNRVGSRTSIGHHLQLIARGIFHLLPADLGLCA